MGRAFAATGPQQAGACVSFFVGTPLNEPQLSLASAWTDRIVAAVANPGRAQVLRAASFGAVLNQMRSMQEVIAANPAGPPIDALGKLNQAAVVLITRALPDDGGAQSVLIYGAEGGAGSVIVSLDHLANLSLVEVTDPLRRRAVVTTRPELQEIAMFCDFLRRSSYVTLYLCTVGQGRAVDRIAARLGELTDLTVHWNNSALILAPSGGPALKTESGTVAQGAAFQSATQVPLSADANSFLPGSERHT